VRRQYEALNVTFNFVDAFEIRVPFRVDAAYGIDMAPTEPAGGAIDLSQACLRIAGRDAKIAYDAPMYVNDAQRPSCRTDLLVMRVCDVRAFIVQRSGRRRHLCR
jgi:hypothetical protein